MANRYDKNQRWAKRPPSAAPKRSLTHEELLLNNAALALNGHEKAQVRLKQLCAVELSAGAAPSFHLLRGACIAYCRMGSAYARAADLRHSLSLAVVLARADGLPPLPLVYTGGALRDYSPDA